MRRFTLIVLLVLFCTASVGCTALLDNLLTDGAPAHEIAEEVTERASESSNPLIALAGAIGTAVLGYGTYRWQKKSPAKKKGKK